MRTFAVSLCLPSSLSFCSLVECPEGTTLCPPTNRCIALVTDLVRADAAMSSCEGAGGRLARFPSEQALDWFFEMRYSHNGESHLLCV